MTLFAFVFLNEVIQVKQIILFVKRLDSSSNELNEVKFIQVNSESP